MTSLNTIQSEYDAIVVGGGMVGASLAVTLAGQNKSVLLLETFIPSTDALSSPPLRVSAINLFSERWLEQQGIWQHINDASKWPFEELATWDQPQHKLVFSAAEIGEAHLGYLVRNEAIQLAALEQVNSLNGVTLSQARLTSFEQSASSVQAMLSLGDESLSVNAKLVFGADGAMSSVRALAGIGTSGWQYQQQCFCLTIKTQFENLKQTFQEFQPSGPKAYLPLAENYASLIWYDAGEQIQTLKTLNNAALKRKVMEIFPELPGDFDVVQTASFPLTRRQAKRYFNGRIVLVGDAAHTINPLAGQGVNLGYQDLAAIEQLLMDWDWEDSKLLEKQLKQYQLKRKTQAMVMSGAMDSFYHLFSNDNNTLRSIRSQFLSLADRSGLAKKLVLKKAVGM